MQLTFFNTINLSSEPLAEATGQTIKQNDRVYGLFVSYGKMTPLECSRVYNDNYPHCPETSIRRAITCLTDQGKLEMLDQMKVEKYGKPNHYWKATPVIN